jgi:hypothetical protein
MSILDTRAPESGGFTVGMCVIKPDAGGFAPLAIGTVSTANRQP